ncbi:hypothetical protein Pelo_5998 [Pelomyxa schiedti]|nr:hypothetical protein Pelo_5998 [Pelomyxa schiedti]
MNQVGTTQPGDESTHKANNETGGDQTAEVGESQNGAEPQAIADDSDVLQRMEHDKARQTLGRCDVQLKIKRMETEKSAQKFNASFKEAVDRLNMYEKRYQEEKARKREREKQLDELQQKLSFLTKEKERKTQELSQLMVYQQFLKRVLERTDEFNSIESLIERWETLTLNSTQLQQILSQSPTHHTDLVQQFVEAQSKQILHLNIQLSQLRNEYKKMVQRNNKMAQKLDSSWDTLKHRHLLYSRLVLACGDLNHCISRGKPISASTSLLEQLDDLHIYLKDVRDVIQQYSAQEPPSPVGKSTSTTTTHNPPPRISIPSAQQQSRPQSAKPGTTPRILAPLQPISPQPHHTLAAPFVEITKDIPPQNITISTTSSNTPQFTCAVVDSTSNPTSSPGPTMPKGHLPPLSKKVSYDHSTTTQQQPQKSP